MILTIVSYMSLRITHMMMIFQIQRELFCVLMDMDQTATFMQVFYHHCCKWHHSHLHPHNHHNFYHHFISIFILVIIITVIIWHEGGCPRNIWYWLHWSLPEMPLGPHWTRRVLTGILACIYTCIYGFYVSTMIREFVFTYCKVNTDCILMGCQSSFVDISVALLFWDIKLRNSAFHRPEDE